MVKPYSISGDRLIAGCNRRSGLENRNADVETYVVIYHEIFYGLLRTALSLQGKARAVMRTLSFRTMKKIVRLIRKVMGLNIKQ
jgi:hypothetical protein